MSLTNILSAEAINKAIKDCEAPDSFCYKKFFQKCGLNQKSPEEVEKVFHILDVDKSKSIEKSELKFFLQRFDSKARILTEKEANEFMSGTDDNNDGKIEVDEFQLMVQSSKNG